MTHDVIIVGAGIAGLALARELHERGHGPLVLERSRGVGGRCATRRVDDRPVDHGVAFLHGRDPRFLAALDAAVPTGGAIEGWPIVRDGDGTPCQPRAFGEQGRRLALRAGVNTFAKSLARGTNVRTNAVHAVASSHRTRPRADAGRWRSRAVSGCAHAPS